MDENMFILNENGKIPFNSVRVDAICNIWIKMLLPHVLEFIHLLWKYGQIWLEV